MATHIVPVVRRPVLKPQFVLKIPTEVVGVVQFFRSMRRHR
jgi:hypothetical protein